MGTQGLGRLSMADDRVRCKVFKGVNSIAVFAFYNNEVLFATRIGDTIIADSMPILKADMLCRRGILCLALTNAEEIVQCEGEVEEDSINGEEIIRCCGYEIVVDLIGGGGVAQVKL